MKKSDYMKKQYYVYILASKRNGTLYVGVTNNLIRRTQEHKNSINEGFTKRYRIYRLVYYEIFLDVREAIWREKKLKKWNRAWKLVLIEKDNKYWNDLYDDLL